MPPDLGQLLGSLFGVTGGAGVGPVGAPTITVTTSGVPGFMTEFMQQVSVWMLEFSALWVKESIAYPYYDFAIQQSKHSIRIVLDKL